MKNRFLKFFVVFLAIMICCFGGGSSAAFAIETVKNFDSTPVLQDLDGSTIKNKQFDLSDYPRKVNGKPEVLTFVEFCYSENTKYADDYALYVYVYNSSGKQIQNTKNAVQLATVYNSAGTPQRYEKFALTICNCSADRLFYKFKIADVGSIYNRVKANSALRKYDLSSIEINYDRVDDFDVGNCWYYSGFAKGCASDETADSTLTCKTNMFETVSLKPFHTCYRYNNGVRTETQLSTVWFSVDNRLLRDYGRLQKIHANYLKARTSEIFVMKEKWLRDIFEPFVGYPDDGDLFGKGLDYMLYWKPVANELGYRIAYNFEAQKQIMLMAYLFYAADGCVSSEELLQYVKNYSELHNDKTVVGKYSKDLFSSVDDDITDINIDADSKFDIQGFTTGSGFLDWFYRLFDNNLQFSSIEDIAPIITVSDLDMFGSDTLIASKLLIAEEDVSSLKETYNAAKLNDQTVVLFRFGVSEYEVYDMVAQQLGSVFYQPHYNKAYMAYETVYLDFDIIDLTFNKDGIYTVMPVVMSPIDIFDKVEPKPSDDLPDWVVWLFIGIAVLIVLVLIMPIVNVFKLLIDVVAWLIKLLCVVIAAPFRFIAWLFKKKK